MANARGATRRRFTREFKLEAVRRLAAGRTPSVVARELGIPPGMLRTWRRQLSGGPAAAAALGGVAPVASQDEEVRRLRREVARLTQERDFLKSATVFFAKESR
jgi:transposase